MFHRSPQLAIYIISILPIVSLANKLYGDWLQRNAIDVQAALAEVTSFSWESFSLIKTVFASSSEEFHLRGHLKLIDKLYGASLRQVCTSPSYSQCVRVLT
jgi:ABC-type multidrug transport system fused ATPase/permease subunit